MNKKGETNWMAIIVIALIAIVGLNAMGVIDVGSFLSTDSGDDSDDNAGGSGIPASQPKLDILAVDLHNPQTSLTTNVLYKINGNAVQTDADGAGIEVNVGDKVEYLVNSSGYYKEKGELTIGNTLKTTVTEKLLQYDTAPTIQIYNQDDGLINTESDTEGLSANANDVQTVKYFSSYKDGIKGATFVVDYLKTNIDDITSSLGEDISEPDSLSHDSRFNADTFRSFLIGDLNANPEVTSSENKEWTFTVDVGGSAYGTENMTIYIMDKDWYSDTKGGFSYGYEEPVDNTDQAQTHSAINATFYTASS